MPVLATDCPHCKAENMGFSFVASRRQGDEPRYRKCWNAVFTCSNCRKCIVLELTHDSEVVNPHQSEGTPFDDGFRERTRYPKPESVSVPEHTPKDIAKDFSEAADSLQRQNFTSAGMMFRKVLQRSTTRLATGQEDLDLTGVRLEKRLGKLAENHLITPAMKEWADIIRAGGNDATHEEDEVFSEDEALAVKEFTEVFLLYAFTLPKRVELATQEVEPDADA